MSEIFPEPIRNLFNDNSLRLSTIRQLDQKRLGEAQKSTVAIV